MLEIRFNAIFALYLYFIGCFALRGCPLGSAFCFAPAEYALFTLKALRSLAPYAETFTCFCSLMLQKLS
ncbi:MAG: hypothetical protein MR481_07595 [Campylobacter sp.]|uniref:hypothetical protein n=1 Tax=Campylobacter sp. TaxID=205 RepID=UPI002AA7DB91|nr:hypothetical protein [Campylobacter sp.]MCI7247762.1 hypothetical protein [Campylobacter sp.]